MRSWQQSAARDCQNLAAMAGIEKADYPIDHGKTLAYDDNPPVAVDRAWVFPRAEHQPLWIRVLQHMPRRQNGSVADDAVAATYMDHDPATTLSQLDRRFPNDTQALQIGAEQVGKAGAIDLAADEALACHGGLGGLRLQPL